MLTLPSECQRVAVVLRRDVPRPAELPAYDDCERLRWRDSAEDLCPMGLHPKALYGAPSCHASLPLKELDNDDVRKFANWWDGLFLTDAAEAMDLIWPRA